MKRLVRPQTILVTGAAGSGVVTLNRSLLEIYNIKPDDIDERFLSYSESIDALRDRKVDCTIISGYYPLAIIEQLAVTRNVRLLDFDKTEEGLSSFPWGAFLKIPANTYSGVDYSVTVFDGGTQYMVGKWLSDDLVYEIVKTIHDNLSELGKLHPVLGTLHFDFDPVHLNNSIAPVHPGAMRFYREIGMVK